MQEEESERLINAVILTLRPACLSFLRRSQTGQERAGPGAPGLQGGGGAQGQPVLHRHPGGLVATGEIRLDQRHQSGTNPPADSDMAPSTELSSSGKF